LTLREERPHRSVQNDPNIKYSNCDVAMLNRSVVGYRRYPSEIQTLAAV